MKFSRIMILKDVMAKNYREQHAQPKNELNNHAKTSKVNS